MTSGTGPENPYAGQGPVLLDIGGDVGALIVTMPAAMEGAEVEIRPQTSQRDQADVQGHHHGHPDEQDDAREHHHPHVAVVSRPVQDTRVASLVFPELVEGRYDLCHKGTQDVQLTVDVRGGEVATAAWPQ